MIMSDCPFCKIVKKEIPADVVYEDDLVIAFKDIYPLAPVHILIIPRKHIESIASLTGEDKDIVSYLIFTAKKIAEEKSLKGYKLVFNVGREAGQTINHLHLHLLSGKISEIP